jgi:hypothetical protein
MVGLPEMVEKGRTRNPSDAVAERVTEESWEIKSGKRFER